jgi:hypothetical protein
MSKTAAPTATDGTAAAPAAPAVAPPAAETTPAPAAEGKPDPARVGGIFAAAGAAPEDGRPADLPDQFWDPEAKQVRLPSMIKALNDMRARVARPGEEAPPASPDAYALPEVKGLPPELVPGDADPVWQAVRQAAHKAGLTQKQLQAVAAPYLAAVAEQSRATADPAKQAAAYEAEMARLGPQGRQVVRDVGSWVSGLVARGFLAKEEADALSGVSTAEGVRALAKLRSLAGEKPIPVEAIDPGGGSYEDAQRMMREAIEKGDDTLGQKAAKALRDLAARGLIPAR